MKVIQYELPHVSNIYHTSLPSQWQSRTTPHYIASYLVTAAIAPEHNIRWSTNDTEYYSVWLSDSELYSSHASWVCCSTDRNTSCEIMCTVYMELYHIHQPVVDPHPSPRSHIYDADDAPNKYVQPPDTCKTVFSILSSGHGLVAMTSA